MSEPAQKLAGLLNLPAGQITDAHLDKVAREVCVLLGTTARPRLHRKLRDWPQLVEEAEDLCQLAALAFIEAFRQGRIRPDEAAGVHTPQSVSAYLWGICNRVFLQTVRRSRTRPIVEGDITDTETSVQHGGGLEELLTGGPKNEESRLWEVLEAVVDHCRPEDIVLTWLHGCGFTVAELQKLLRISRNIPANAIRRVGQAVRSLLGLSGDEVKKANAPPPSPRKPRSESPFDLLQQKRFSELLDLLSNPALRNSLLLEAAAHFGPIPDVRVTAEENLAGRMSRFAASGDWSWGLLSADERRALLARDAALLKGAGIPDGGVAQKAALKKLVADLGSIFQELDAALLGDDLDWLMPLAKHLSSLLLIISEFKEMRQRCGVLLEAAQRLNSPRLELYAQLGLCRAQCQLGDYDGALQAGEAARELALGLGDRHVEGNAVHNLGNVKFLQGDYNEARKLFAQTLAIRRSIGDRHGEANALLNLGVVDTVFNNYSVAREFLEGALAVQRSLGDRLGEAKSLSRLGLVEKGQGNFSAARERLGEALAIQREMGNRYEEAFSLTSLGTAEYLQGNYSAAREHLEEALAIQRSLDSQYGVECCLLRLGNSEYLQGNYGAVRELIEEALAIQRDLGDRYGESSSLQLIGDAEFMQGNFSATRDLYAQALVIFQYLGNKDTVARTCVACGAVLAALGFLRLAALAIYAGLARTAELSHGFLPTARPVYDESLARLDAAVASGEITADQLAMWKAQGEAMSLDELADFTLVALAEAASVNDDHTKG